ncbi:YnbE family lipoprotein [Marinihelvus fidelis]|uniref:YnbE family lipoprotein n=1 Tax=Marinihelvus fidelis TaxID=2613842 RepID=A0A5N0TEV9_9GAMM|nr:YnbE family lipoprotein [Marinihelvus fidelis]KAA9132647.1 YnbE family lipoprotein [Marinihelvus fidelis]
MPRKLLTMLVVITAAGLIACNPTVKVEAPDKPIEINMNVNIRHEILVKVEKEVEEMFEDEDLF